MELGNLRLHAAQLVADVCDSLPLTEDRLDQAALDTSLPLHDIDVGVTSREVDRRVERRALANQRTDNRGVRFLGTPHERQ